MTKPKRKAITLKTKVAVLEAQALCGCGCGERLAGEPVEYDHALAHALEGSDGPENIRAVRKSCHDRISNGTKATTAGSTKATVAKVKRLERETAGKPKRKRLVAKIPSRGFPKPPPGHKRKILTRAYPWGRKVGA